MLEIRRPEVTSPAMKLLLQWVERNCLNPLVPSAARFLPHAYIFMSSLNSLVNPTATMTEEQAGSLSDYIVDKWLPKNPPYTDYMERLPLATYINSCRA